MEQMEVEIVVQTITAQYGTLEPGDVLRTNAEFAAHLVRDCGAGQYRKPHVAPQPVAAVEILVPSLAVSVDAIVQTSARLTPTRIWVRSIAAVPGPADEKGEVAGVADVAVQTSAQADETLSSTVTIAIDAEQAAAADGAAAATAEPAVQKKTRKKAEDA